MTPGPSYEGWLPGVESLCYGGDYNAEQWPREVWAQDVRLMTEAGVNLVSVGIFSWVRLEPRPGEYDFAWLDELLDGLHAGGIRVDLATPTVVPPAWFFRDHPEARVVTRDGVPLGPGSRGAAAPSSPQYRAAAARITTELARRYGDHPAVVLWHVHNEYGAPVGWDYSEHALVAFRRWLADRYGGLDALNAAWGTTFWGQVYGGWDEVALPGPTPTAGNPAQLLDFARFSDEMLRELYRAERDIIRQHSDRPVTTNFMAGTHLGTDLWRWGQEVDVVANDNYLMAADVDNHVGLALSADLTRSVAGGKPWILMEHSSSGVNWQPRNVAKKPGEEKRNAFSHVGRGADAVLFFQWRASRFGAEKFHSAMVPHAGTDSRVWRELVELGGDLAGLAALRGTRTVADVAILWDYESFWAQDLDWRPSVDLRHREQVEAYYRRLWHDGVTVDLAHPEQDLSAYRLVLAPSQYLLTAAGAANLTAYVASGGTLLVGPFSGIVDEHDAVHPGGFMAPLKDVLGVWVEELLPLREGETLTVTHGDATLEGRVWADHLRVTTARTVGTYATGPAPGLPAITRNEHGAGTGWYVSTVLDGEALRTVLADVYADAGVVPAAPGAPETIVRRGADADYVVAVNHADHDVDLELPGGPTVVRAGDVAVFEVER
ncbi:beta-galactosidase [Xylanimonas protaetiae]|uniref:Beta-galactosidase n=1 Tax=Xylanimonas protaetiae TaxID=2509457 RepID=A0A4P6F715_9MICO|nr:beta-galactosidase [Xylanimonas protaetiae]QAY71454.1 beta-galactosidase [Xylanimonas protaetiae]